MVGVNTPAGQDQNFEKFRAPPPTSVYRELSEPFNARKYFGARLNIFTPPPPRHNKFSFP